MSAEITRQKDFPELAQPLDMELFDVAGTGSAVLRLAAPGAIAALNKANIEKALDALRDAGATGLTIAEWEQATGINRHTHHSIRGRLKTARLAELRDKRWFALPPPDYAEELRQVMHKINL